MRRESANHAKARHRSGYERDAYRSIRGLIGEGCAVIARLPKRVPLGRARPLTGATAIAASIGLVIAFAAFLGAGNDAGVGTSATAPVVPNPVVAEASPVQPPAPPPVSPDIQTSAAADATEPASASLDAPAGKAAAASRNRNPNQARPPRAASKRTAPPAPMRTARPARAPKSASSPAATQEQLNAPEMPCTSRGRLKTWPGERPKPPSRPSMRLVKPTTRPVGPTGQPVALTRRPPKRSAPLAGPIGGFKSSFRGKQFPHRDARPDKVAELDTEFAHWHDQMRGWVNGFIRAQQRSG